MEQDFTSDYSYHYRKWHNESDSHFSSMSDYFARKLRSLDVLKPGQRVLEVGCGWGFCLGGLAQLGINDADAYDIDPTAVALCQSRGFNAKLLAVVDIGPWMDEHAGLYDTILAFDVVEHVPSDTLPNVLRGIFHALKPGGVLVCQVPNADSIIASHMRHVDHTHYTAFTATSLDGLLHEAGFNPATVTDADLPEQRPSWQQRGRLKMWAVKKIIRKVMRAIYVAELGDEGWRVPLDKNIIAVAQRPACAKQPFLGPRTEGAFGVPG